MPSFTLKLATLLRSRREKFLRFTTSSEISSMPCRPSLASESTINWLNCWSIDSTLPPLGVVVVDADHTSV